MGDDDIRDLPGIRATDDDRVTAQPGARRTDAEPPVVRARREPPPRRQRNGALWAVCLSLLVALVGLGYWSHQQQARLQQQLVATQESFARISEEAAGRLQDISGKVVATESSLSQNEQTRIQQLNQLQKQVEQLTTAQQTQQERLQQQQQGLERLQQADVAQGQRLTVLDGLAGTLGEQIERQQQASSELVQKLESADSAQAALRSDLEKSTERLQALTKLERQLAEQDTQLARQRGELEALLQASAGASLEQEMLVLRSEIDERLAMTEESLQAIDSFRLQTNRSISTLRNQLGNLQQQLGQR